MSLSKDAIDAFLLVPSRFTNFRDVYDLYYFGKSNQDPLFSRKYNEYNQILNDISLDLFHRSFSDFIPKNETELYTFRAVANVMARHIVDTSRVYLSEQAAILEAILQDSEQQASSQDSE